MSVGGKICKFAAEILQILRMVTIEILIILHPRKGRSGDYILPVLHTSM